MIDESVYVHTIDTVYNHNMITNHGLLYIEPELPQSAEPVIDDLTERMSWALQQDNITGVLMPDGSFIEGDRWRGYHFCKCGVRSEHEDYKLSNGMITNALATHYLAWHRIEVPASQLALVKELPPAEGPVVYDVTSPRAR